MYCKKTIGPLVRFSLVFGLFFLLAAIGCSCGNSSVDNVTVHNPFTNPLNGPPAVNPNGTSPIPAAAGLEDTANPDHVIGTGTPESCNPDSFIKAVGKGGKIVFNCGPKPTTITLNWPAKVFNDGNPNIVIDGVGLITLINPWRGRRRPEAAPTHGVVAALSRLWMRSQTTGFRNPIGGKPSPIPTV